MIKNVYKSCLIALAGLLGTANALEIRPFFELLFPSKVNVNTDVDGKTSDKKMDSDIEFMGGSEVLFTPNIPIRYGFGLGVKSAQQKGDTIITPAMLPLWGVITYDPLKGRAVSPYVVARAGTLMPLTGNGNWWEKPLNFTVSGGIGAIFPYHIGLEVIYDYTSVLKSFKSVKTKFRASSGRDANNTWNTETEDSSNFNTSDTESQESSFDYSGGAYSPEPDTTTPDMGYGYGATEESSTEPSGDSATSTPESTEPVTEEPAATEGASEPEAEAAAEPEPEPEAEPAPEPDPKPAAKKSSKKTTKKASKKKK